MRLGVVQTLEAMAGTLNQSALWIGFTNTEAGPVPGDWWTGDRLTDIVAVPIACSLLFPLVRIMLKKFLFEVSTAVCHLSITDYACA